MMIKDSTIILPSVWLTIGIPTFKKPECLKKCLNSLFNNIPEDHRHRVEIIVVDNDDNHSAKLICENFAIKCIYMSGNYKIRTTESSISIIESNSNGLYIWYLGDDDYVISPLDSIFNLFKYRPDIILLSYYHLNLRFIYLINKFFPLFFLRNIIQFILHYRLGFTSMQIFARKLDKNYFINDKFYQMGFLNKSLSILSNSKKLSIVDFPIFFDSPTTRTYLPFEYFNIFFIQVLCSLRPFPIAWLGYLFWSIIFFRIPGANNLILTNKLPYPVFIRIIFIFFIYKSFFITFYRSIIKR